MDRALELILKTLLFVSWLRLCSAAAPEKDFFRSLQQFKTEPSFRASRIEVKSNTNPARLSQGYFFISPFVHNKQDIGWGGAGPQIFDHDGELIWYGNHTATHRVMRVHVCHYLGLGSDHICYHDGPRLASAHAEGVIRLFDNTYTQVTADFGAVGGLGKPDAHEMNTPLVMNGTSMLQDVYKTVKMDLTQYEGPKNGHVLDCCFQEVDIRSREVLFQWCALDVLPLWHTSVFPKSETAINYTSIVSGVGNLEDPWDPYHLNGMDKNEEGDYLISLRHWNAVLKIAGNNNVMGKKPGEVVWTLGGTYSDFKANFIFSRQHVARFISTGPEVTRISLLNNAYDGAKSTAPYSNGLILDINNSTWEATIFRLYAQPNKLLCGSAGSFQSLANGNKFIGWGSKPWFTEFGPDGAVLLNARYSGGESAQVWKSPWVGNPLTNPKILTYKRSMRGEEPFWAYMSWNGATEVHAWRIYVSNISTNGPWIDAGRYPRKGFETAAVLPIPFAMFAYASALDRMDQVLGESEARKTFVPLKSKKQECDDKGCFEPEYFSFNPAWSVTSRRVPWAVVVVCFGAIESYAWLYTTFFVRPRARRRRRLRPPGLLEKETDVKTS